jgi:hypothetical protein
VAKGFVPVTPAGTPVPYGMHGRAGMSNIGETVEEAIEYLLEDAGHMPYGTWQNFQRRGYTIMEWDDGV